MFLDNRVTFSRSAIRIAGIYGLNYYDVLISLCCIASKYNCTTIQDTCRIFVQLYQQYIEKNNS